VKTFDLSTGNTLAYQHRPPRDPAGITFVYFNALTGDKSVWESGIDPDLEASGHGMLAFNYRGQAGSEFTSDSFDESSIVEDAAALIEHIGPEAPVFVGLSIGGLFAAKVHLNRSPGTGLVFINTLRRDGPRLQWINDALVRAAEVGGLALLRDLYAPLLFNEDWQRENRANFLKDEGYIPLGKRDGDYLLLKSGSTADWNLPLEDIRVPVLNITGLQDHVFFNANDVDTLLGRLPDAERLDMPDAGHLIPAEKPTELAGVLEAFARRCRSRRRQ